MSDGAKKDNSKVKYTNILNDDCWMIDPVPSHPFIESLKK